MKKSFYKNTMLLPTMLSILSGIIIVILFYSIEMNYIDKGATQVLQQQLSSEWQQGKQFLPEVYFVDVEEENDNFLTDMEQELIQYYIKNQQNFHFQKIYHFTKNYDIYFYPIQAGNQKTDGILLVYTDVSFSSNIVKTVTWLLLAVTAVISVLLYILARRMIRILYEKDKNMKEFFSNASHELKTPLMAVRGYAEGLSEGMIEHKKACAVIIKEIERMSSLINTILEISKLDSGIVQTHKAKNDIREIIYDAIQVIEPAAKQKEIAVIFDLPEPILFYCDEDMLFSVFSNILTNAIRYAKSNIVISYQIKIEVLTIWISNDDTTISPEDLKHIFDRFYKGTKGQTGIGMALSLEYIRLHHGNIVVYTKENRTIFEITIKK